MKKYLVFAAAAALFAACSENDLAEGQSPKVQTEPGAVLFDSYVNRATTRSGQNGTMTLSTDNSRKLQETGFGVFGYYTDNNDYSALTIPNFFYNQQITWSTTWGYTPVKYWPNEYGSSAIADDNDKVSYFAYAPWVNVVPGNGKPDDQTFGITQLSHNSATGDPYVKYIASFDWTKAVDLMWGVVPSTSTSWGIVSGETQTLAEGLPWLNVERPSEANTQAAATQRVKFNFLHALAKLNVQVDHDADVTSHVVTPELDATTRVYVRSISFTGFSTKGALNLNNVEPNVPLWKAYDATNDLEPGEVTILNDGRKDGKEGVGGAVASNEPNKFINPALIQQGGWSGDNKGVLAKPQNVFAFPASDKVAADMKLPTQTKKINVSSVTGFAEAVGIAGATEWDYTTDDNATALLNWPVMVIPNGDEITVTIVYDIETVDPNLATKLSDGATKGSSIENRITKTITFGGDVNYMEAGKKYTIKLHLGLNSVKFEAEVDAWDTPAIEGETWLPDNVVSYQAPGVYNYQVAAGATANKAFKLTGFAPKESVSNVAASPATYAAATLTAGANGEVNIAASAIAIAANTTVLNVTTDNAVTFTGNVSGKQVALNLVQAAAQPNGGKSTLTFDAEKGTFALKDASETGLTGDIWQGNTRNVQIISATRNGVPMTELNENETVSTTTQFKVHASEKAIVLSAAPATGEVFIFTIKAGDSEAITIKKTI